MGGRLDPAVAATRTAVRRVLADLAPGSLVLVACSGGPDSLALAAATAHVAPRVGLRAGAVVVDHGLRADSAAVAERAADAARALALAPVDVVRVHVRRTATGPEAAARDARHRALERAAARHVAAAVLLAHHRDDQAEQVLLGLARGSGARSLAGMPARRGLLRRPFLELPRALIEKAIAAQGLVPWHDPANEDRTFARNRVRHDVLPLLEQSLGPGIDAALARTARQLRQDADALDALADDAEQRARDPRGGWSVGALAELPVALRSRVLRIVGGGRASDVQVRAMDALVTDWHGQGPVAVTGGRTVRRADDRMHTD